MKKKLLIVLVILIVALGLFLFLKKDKKDDISYNAVPVERRNIDVNISATGTVKPKNRLEIKAPISGRIDKVLINEGLIVKKGQILAWMSSTERAAMLDAAISKGQEEYKKWEELYLSTAILAPIDGTIILKKVEPGQTITTADAIFVMSDILSVQAQVDETDIAQIKKGFTAQIILDAYPNEKIQAKVDQLAFDSSTTNNVTTYAVDVIPEQIPEFMRSGMTANVTFNVQARENVLAIPAEALQINQGKTIVLKREKDQNIEVEVRTGSTDGKYQEIISGLNEDDFVMIQNYEIKDSKKSTTILSHPGSNRRKR